jgi:5'-nucleotidase/UDP-sugar diphosphatase
MLALAAVISAFYAQLASPARGVPAPPVSVIAPASAPPQPQVASIAPLAVTPAPVAATPTPAAVASARVHVVVRGDTLWGIAKTHVGDARQYPDLAKRSRIPNPHRIQPGDVVQIESRERARP